MLPDAAVAGLADASGSAMMAARQAAAAQLEQFRAEMVAEAAKVRAAVERQVLPHIPYAGEKFVAEHSGELELKSLISKLGLETQACYSKITAACLDNLQLWSTTACLGMRCSLSSSAARPLPH